MLMDGVVYQLPIGPVIAQAGGDRWFLYTMDEWADGRPARHVVDRAGRILCDGRSTRWTTADLEESLTATAMAMLGRRLSVVPPRAWPDEGATADSA